MHGSGNLHSTAPPDPVQFCVLRLGHPGVLTDSGLAASCLDIADECRYKQSAFWQSETGWHQVDYHDWGVRLRRSSTSPVSLVMGPPVAPKAGRNRLRLEVTNPDWETGEFLDPCGNEFHVAST